MGQPNAIQCPLGPGMSKDSLAPVAIIPLFQPFLHHTGQALRIHLSTSSCPPTSVYLQLFLHKPFLLLREHLQSVHSERLVSLQNPTQNGLLCEVFPNTHISPAESWHLGYQSSPPEELCLKPLLCIRTIMRRAARMV